MSTGEPDKGLVKLFKQEVVNHTDALSYGLLDWEKDTSDISKIEPLMRAAHSLKGAARIIGLTKYSDLAHVLEDCFVAAQDGKITLTAEHYDVLLDVVDFLADASSYSDDDVLNWPGKEEEKLKTLQQALEGIRGGGKAATKPATPEETKKESKEELTDKDETDSLFIVFSSEAINQTQSLNEKLKILEKAPTSMGPIDPMIMSIQAIIGASEVAEQKEAHELAKEIEGLLKKVKDRDLSLDNEKVKGLADKINQIKELASKKPIPKEEPKEKEVEKEEKSTPSEEKPEEREKAPTDEKKADKKEKSKEQPTPPKPAAGPATVETKSEAEDQIVRVSAGSLNRLMSLAAESLVETRKLQTLKQGLFNIKSIQQQLTRTISNIQAELGNDPSPETIKKFSKEFNENTKGHQRALQSELEIFDEFERKNSLLSSRLYGEVLASRMRPFKEGVRGLPRLVRDLGRSLNKKISLEITGEDTPVDRDILEKLESPLNHIIRNACDHGIETPDKRKAAGKDEQGTIKMHAFHSGGMLSVTISDDGGGIDKEKIRTKVLKKKLLTEEMAETLSEDELFDFLFLPAFSTSENVTDISGRGVGLDVVQNLMQKIGGKIRVESELGKGTTFHLQLPITRSVIRTLLVKINGEPYSFPLSRITHTIHIAKKDILTLENREYFHLEGHNVAMISADSVLGFEEEYDEDLDEIPVVILKEKENYYSLIIEAILGETELVVRPLDSRLGKVPCISSASITDDGFPVLILDVDDLLKYIEKLLSGAGHHDTFDKKKARRRKTKTILIVDDSITVRETERQLLQNAGYTVEVAVDGVDGWNTLRSGKFDLVVSDIDMPRMNGFDLVELIKTDDDLKKTPVIIISYKDREEDRIKGLEVGADYYLTKSSFRDETFINAVKDLIGEP